MCVILWDTADRGVSVLLLLADQNKPFTVSVDSCCSAAEVQFVWVCIYYLKFEKNQNRKVGLFSLDIFAFGAHDIIRELMLMLLLHFLFVSIKFELFSYCFDLLLLFVFLDLVNSILCSFLSGMNHSAINSIVTVTPIQLIELCTSFQNEISVWFDLVEVVIPILLLLPSPSLPP